MKEADKKRFSVALYWLAGKYPLGRDEAGDEIPRELSKEWLKDYFEAFQDMHICRFEAGVKRHYAHEQYFPDRPATLRKNCEQVVMPRDGWLAAPERVQIPETAESLRPELARETAEKLNATFGTSLYVDESGVLKAGGNRGKG